MQSLFRAKLLQFLNLSSFYNDDVDDVEVINKTTLLYFLFVIGFLILFIFAFISFSGQFYILCLIEIVTLLLIVILTVYLRKTSKYYIVSVIYALFLGIIFQYLLITGGIDKNGHTWSFLFPVGVMFFFGYKKGLLVSIIFLVLAFINITYFSIYSKLLWGFKLRYFGVYISLMMIAFVYEFTKSKLLSKIMRQNTELIDATKKAEKAEKLKSEFLAQMSHEIRTPVNTILNYTSLLKAEFQDKLTGELTDCFSSINIASNRLIRTIDLILNLSTIESGSYTPFFEKVSLSSDIILNVAEEFEYYARLKNIELIYIPEIENDEILSLDKYTITQALSNLVDNAIKYTSQGRIEIRLKKEREKILLEVADTGIGISREYLPNLFDKFSQETQGYTRIYEGNGLGLALVKEYCKLNKSSIKVKSEKGVGTTFTIEFNTAAAKLHADIFVP